MYSRDGKARVTEENLRSIVEAQRVKGPIGQTAFPEERLEFYEVQKLDLGFKGISMIECLWEFTALTTLHLNNNCIQKLEGLSRLTNLISLNLSFNSIMVTEGLESLKKLEELNLSNNKISVLENLDCLEKLASFNIASNNLKDLNQVMYLKKFKKIFSLNFSGNPLSENDNYKYFVIAFFPNLKFLDYRYVQLDTKKQAMEKFHTEIQQLRREDMEREKKTEASKAQQAEQRLHADAFVESLNGSFLFEHMIEEDPLANKLQAVPEIAAQHKLFKEKMTDLCVQLFEIGLVKLKQREAEVNSFYTSHSITKAEMMQEESQLLAEFEKYFKELKKESAPASETLKTSPDQELQKLHSRLLALEFKLIGQIEVMIKKLDAEVTELINVFFKTAQDIFAQCRDLENKYYHEVQGIAAETVERVEKDEDDVDDLPQDVKMVFLDKETVMGALTTAHENHLLTIRDRESQLMSRANSWKNRLIKKLREEELRRNRVALSDFTIYVNHCEEEIQKLFNR